MIEFNEAVAFRPRGLFSGAPCRPHRRHLLQDSDAETIKRRLAYHLIIIIIIIIIIACIAPVYQRLQRRSGRPCDVGKARLLAAGSPHSLDWLNTPELTATGLRPNCWTVLTLRVTGTSSSNVDADPRPVENRSLSHGAAPRHDAQKQ